jgi:hypothetical protein
VEDKVRSENFEAIFRRDLDRLPGLADDEWLPRTRRQPRRLTLGRVAALAGLALLAVVVGLRMQAVPDDQDGAGPAASSPHYIATQSTAERYPGTSLVASNALTGAPSCPGSQIPWLVASFPARPGAEPPTGSASPEAAFRKANPAVTEFTMYLWSVSQPVRGDDPRISVFIPMWIVAGNETFLVRAASFGPANETSWFASPAKFMGCIAASQPSRTNVPRR